MTNAETYLKHLETITGRPIDVIRQADSTKPKLPAIAIPTFKDWPEPGFITGFTFGLSAAHHVDWNFGRPELMISVRSADEAWPFGVAFIAEQLRGACPFSYGNAVRFGEKISGESDMDAFLVFTPPFLKKEQIAVKLSGFTCYIAGMYPLHASEMEVYQQVGIDRFWQLPGLDPYDVHRKPVQPPA